MYVLLVCHVKLFNHYSHISSFLLLCLVNGTSFFFTVPLWRHCRSRSLILMLSVNEEAVIVRGVMKRRPDLRLARGLFSSSAAALTSFYRPETESSGRTCLRFLGQRRRGGAAGRVHRKTQSGSGLSFYSNLCKCCALLFTPDLWLLCSGNMTAVINCQTSTILVLASLPNKTDYICHKIIWCTKKKQRVWWYSQSW